MNIKALIELSMCNIKNDIGFPIWIYKVENIKVNEKRYLKIYLLNRLFNNAEVKQITFKHHDKECIVKKFNVISAYNDVNIFGCVIGVDEKDESIELKIIKEFVGNNVYEAHDEEVFYTMENTEGKDMEYIVNKFPQLKIFPKVEAKYYQCLCGRINNLEHSCHCGKTLSEINNVINFDVKEDKITNYLHQEIVYNPEKTFEENIDKYCESFAKINNLEVNDIKQRMDLTAEEEKYNKVVKADQEKKNKIKIAKEKTKKMLVIVCFAVSLLIATIVIANIFAKEYVTYFTCSFKETYIEKCRCYGSLNVLDSKEKADKYFKLEAKKLYENGLYAEVEELYLLDGIYSIGAKKNKNNFTRHDFTDSELEEIYINSLYKRVLNNKDDLTKLTNYKTKLEYYTNKYSKEIDGYIYNHYVNIIEEGNLGTARYFHKQYISDDSRYKGDGGTLVNMQKTLHYYLSKESTDYKYSLSPDDYSSILSEFGYKNVKDFYYVLKDGGYSKKILEDQCYDRIRLMGYWSYDGAYINFYQNDDGRIWCSYNLPTYNYGDYYEIYNSVYRLVDENTGESKKVFSFSFLDDDGIKVYCYKDGSYHYLYK